MTAIFETADTKHFSTGIFQAAGQAVHEVRNGINDVRHHYQPRQINHELAALDDHLLADIGVHRAVLPAASRSDFDSMRQDIYTQSNLIG